MGVDIRIINSNGQNLLNPATPNSIKKEDIKLYYLIDGKKKEVLAPNLDHPRHFMLHQVESQSEQYPGEYLIRVFMNDKSSNGSENATTYIEWSNTDTLVCQVRKAGASVFCEKVLYNDVVKWDITSDPRVEDKTFGGRFFQVVK